MTTYYVATLSTYVLVTAASEAEARELGLPEIARLGQGSLNIRTVRPATADEIEFMEWDAEQRQNEAGR